jgi:hypothetical protein
LMIAAGGTHKQRLTPAPTDSSTGRSVEGPFILDGEEPVAVALLNVKLRPARAAPRNVAEVRGRAMSEAEWLACTDQLNGLAVGTRSRRRGRLPQVFRADADDRLDYEELCRRADHPQAHEHPEGGVAPPARKGPVAPAPLWPQMPRGLFRDRMQQGAGYTGTGSRHSGRSLRGLPTSCPTG